VIARVEACISGEGWNENTPITEASLLPNFPIAIRIKVFEIQNEKHSKGFHKKDSHKVSGQQRFI
jgi:hypothetical protein